MLTLYEVSGSLGSCLLGEVTCLPLCFREANSEVSSGRRKMLEVEILVGQCWVQLVSGCVRTSTWAMGCVEQETEEANLRTKKLLDFIIVYL